MAVSAISRVLGHQRRQISVAPYRPSISGIRTSMSSAQSLQEGIVFAFRANGGDRAVPAVDDGVVG